MESITSYMQEDHALIDGFAGRALQAAAARMLDDSEGDGARVLLVTVKAMAV